MTPQMADKVLALRQVGIWIPKRLANISGPMNLATWVICLPCMWTVKGMPCCLSWHHGSLWPISMAMP